MHPVARTRRMAAQLKTKGPESGRAWHGGIDRLIWELRARRATRYGKRVQSLQKTKRSIYVLNAIKRAGRPPGPVKLTAALGRNFGTRSEMLAPFVFACSNIPAKVIGGSMKVMESAVAHNRLPKILTYLARSGKEVTVSELAGAIKDDMRLDKRKRTYRYGLLVLEEMGLVKRELRRESEREQGWIVARVAKEPGRIPRERVAFRLIERLAAGPQRLTVLVRTPATRRHSLGRADGIAPYETVEGWLSAWQRAGVVRRRVDGLYGLTQEGRKIWMGQQKSKFLTDEMRRITTVEHPFKGVPELGPEIIEAAESGIVLSEILKLRKGLRTAHVAKILRDDALVESMKEMEKRYLASVFDPKTRPESNRLKYTKNKLILLAEEGKRRLAELEMSKKPRLGHGVFFEMKNTVNYLDRLVAVSMKQFALVKKLGKLREKRRAIGEENEQLRRQKGASRKIIERREEWRRELFGEINDIIGKLVHAGVPRGLWEQR